MLCKLVENAKVSQFQMSIDIGQGVRSFWNGWEGEGDIRGGNIVYLN